MSSRTASELRTAGPAPASTAARIAVAVDSEIAGSASSTPAPRCRRSASSSASRVPEPCSRVTSGVAASSAGRHRPPATGPRVVGRDDGDQLVVADDPRAQLGWHPRTLDEAQVGSAVADVGDGGLAVDRGQLEVGRPRRSSLGGQPEGDQPPGQQLFGDGLARADPQPPAPVLPQGGEAGVELGGDVHQPGGPLGHHDTLAGQLGTTGAAAQQNHAGLGLDGPHPGRHGLLTHADLGGGPVEAAGPATASSTSIAASSGTCPLSRITGTLTRATTPPCRCTHVRRLLGTSGRRDSGTLHPAGPRPRSSRQRS